MTAKLLVLLAGAGSFGLSAPVRAQGAPPLSFLGFSAGGLRAALEDTARLAGRGTLTCRRATTDGRLAECRGGLPQLDSGRSVDLWVSLIDGRAAVLTLSARLAPARFERWRALLEGRYGSMAPRRQGPMLLLQWVRGGQMLRLAWRARGRDVEASVSLVDGPLLDAWANVGRRPER